MRGRPLAGLGFALASLVAVAADAPFTVTAISAEHPGSGNDYRFPRVQGPEPATTAINTWLQATQLHQLPDRQRQTAFENVWPQGDGDTGLTGLTYAVGHDDARYLSLALTGEYSQAYPSGFEHSFNFDAASGRPIELADLFTPAGLTHLRTRVIAERVRVVRAHLAQLQAGTEDADDQRLLYEDCLQPIREEPLEANDLHLTADGLTLQRGGCAAHAQLALDVLGPLKTTIARAAIQDGLSDYGRCLLAPAAAAPATCRLPPATGLHPGVYRGTLGKAAITLVIERVGADGDVGGGYFYDRYARFIELGGARSADGRVRLGEESGDGDAPRATLVLRAGTDGGLDGEWQGRPRSLPIHLKPLR